MSATTDELAAVLGGDVSNAGAWAIQASHPYVVRIRIIGTAAMLFHRWQSDAVEAKASAAKGSAAKKKDDLESYVYRDDDNICCLPGEYVRGSVCGPQGSAKFRQDPRSPRKSALDMCKSGIVAMTDLARITTFSGQLATHWDYEDRRRATVQRAGITRERPAFRAGWSAEMDFQVLLPEYIPPGFFRELLIDAGRLVGVADFRPTFGRFTLDSFQLLET